jgi:DNA-binding beta-propeller fold protein YncE
MINSPYRRWLILFALFLFFVSSCQNDSKEPHLPQIVGEVDIAPYGPSQVAVNSQTGNVYVLAGSAVFILNGSEQVMMIPTEAGRPPALAVDEETGWVYVADLNGHSVIVLQDTELVATVELSGETLLDVAVEPHNGLAYVLSGYEIRETAEEKSVIAGKVSILKGIDIVSTISLGHMIPTHVVANPVNGNVYVGGVGGTLVILKGLEEVGRLELSSSVNAVDVNPETGEVYVIAGQELSQIKGTELIFSEDLIEGNGGLTNLRVDPISGNAYTINTGSEVIVTHDSNIISRLDIGRALSAMTVDPLTGNVYVADYYENKVTVINGTEVIGFFDVGWYPYGIGVNPANGWVYVSNTNGDTITVLGYE